MLKYIGNTIRLDIACSVSFLARYVDDPHEIHMKSLRAIVDYLVNTRSKGIYFERMGPIRHTKTTLKFMRKRRKVMQDCGK